MKTYIALALLMIIPVSLQEEKKCTKPGLKEVHGPDFTICNVDANGLLVDQQGKCDYMSEFDPTEKRCTLKDGISMRSGTDVERCYTKGRHCSNCSTLNYCWDRGRGLEIVETKQCEKHQICNFLNNSCTNGSVDSCVKHSKFICNYMGIFPDPLKCDIYYFCSSTDAEPVTVNCPSGQYYDPLYSMCVTYEIGKETPCPPTKPCTADDKMFPLERNPNIYYICIWEDGNQFVNRMFRCNKDLIFNGVSCVPKSASTTSGSLSGPFKKKY